MTETAELIRSATLRPGEAQGAFRAVLDAVACPGRVTRLPEGLSVPPALLPVLALADLGTGVHVLADEPRWADVVGVATGAFDAPLDQARLVAALRAITGAELRALCRGSAQAPEDAALATLAVSDVAGGDTVLRLAGPGIPGTVEIAPRGLPRDFAAARGHADFPAGVDLLLVAPDGRLLGLPRSTAVTAREN